MTREDGLPNSAVRALAQWGGPDGHDLWIGTGRGLVRLSGSRMVVYTKEQGLSPGGIEILLPSVARDGTPILWAASNYDGLAEFHDDGSWLRTTRETGMPDDAVLSLLQTDLDRKPPVLWIGAAHAGVMRRETDAWAAFDERNGLPHRVVMSIGEGRFLDGLTAIWLGSIDGSVRWNGMRWESWLPEKYKNRIVNDMVGDGDVLWIGTDRGLLRMTKDGLREYTLDNSILPGSAVIGLMLENDAGGNTLWIGTHHGLAHIRNDKLEIENLSDPPQEHFVRVLRTTSLADGSHLLWAGTDSGLVYKSSGHWHGLPQGCLAQSSVMDLRERGQPGSDHLLWVASRDGVSLVDLDHDLACRRVDVLPRSIVYQLQFDGRDRVYAFGVDGVTRLRADARQASGYATEHFALEDGLPGLEFNRASLVDHAGRIWGGSTEGVVLYDPAIETGPAPPRPLRLLSAREEGSGRALTDGTQFGAAENDIAFDFSLLSYQRDHMTRYRAELAGLDAQPEDWNDSTHRSYSRLPPGDYTFRVRARDGQGVESDPATLRFHIDTPLWLRPWAIALYALALIAFSLGIGRLRALAVERRAEELKEEVKERTKDLATANEQLERASLTDPLTGLWNRRYFLMEMQPESERMMRRVHAHEPHADVVFLLVDLDHFKRINDNFGHAGGDAVLVEFARRVADLVRASDIALRWGGEEFLIVLRDTEREAAAAFAERVRHAVVMEPFLVDARRVNVSCSIGWAAYPFRREDPRAYSLEQVIALADQALYRAKEQGRNRVCGAIAGGAAQVRYTDPGECLEART
jgi:diguanylate cyclase (GGDEF)-like protein